MVPWHQTWYSHQDVYNWNTYGRKEKYCIGISNLTINVFDFNVEHIFVITKQLLGVLYIYIMDEPILP